MRQGLRRNPGRFRGPRPRPNTPFGEWPCQMRRQVSWLAGHHPSPAFPVAQWPDSPEPQVPGGRRTLRLQLRGQPWLPGAQRPCPCSLLHRPPPSGARGGPSWEVILICGCIGCQVVGPRVGSAPDIPASKKCRAARHRCRNRHGPGLIIPDGEERPAGCGHGVPSADEGCERCST